MYLSMRVWDPLFTERSFWCAHLRQPPDGFVPTQEWVRRLCLTQLSAIKLLRVFTHCPPHSNDPNCLINERHPLVLLS
jgi:hypothetical protein